MTAPLARDQHGNAFELPSEAAFWRVRRNTGGRPADVLNSDGEPLYVPISDDRLELRGKGCTGSIRLEAVDVDRKPLGIQPAYIDLGNGDDGAQRMVASIGDKDLVRACFDSMTRTMESMQRAQVERERTLAQKEQSITEAQISTQKMMVELMLALMDRVGGGKPQGALSLLRQQFEIQKAIEKQAGTHRNAEPPALPAPVEEAPSTGIPMWLKTAAPGLLFGAQEIAVNLFAKDDPAKADLLRRSIGGFGSMLTNAGAMPQPAPAVMSTPTIEEDVARPTPRALRQILALLEDDEAIVFEDQLADLDDAGFAALNAHVQQLPTLEERVAWARNAIRPAAQPETPKVNAQPATELPGVPPQLVPVLLQLSPDERMLGLQLVSWLDRATTEKLIAELLALPPEGALAKIRRMIDEAQRRGPSVAQRAVASVFAEGKNGGGENGAPNAGGAS